MSMLLALLMIAPSDEFAAYRAATRAEVPCSRASSTDEVTVCGRREADRRYRVPLVGIPVRDQVLVQTDRLLEDKIDRCGRQLMTNSCGFVGVTMTSGGAGTSLKPRKLKE
ncbi:hypothetical protein ACFSC3_08835 [Sphingomonas floccifaciens]|uniref:Secreted protein n=1 Tax=Sphingomonas floccifaciens TaxID=1844115 RepID=A0ABW4NCC0_9SPHN